MREERLRRITERPGEEEDEAEVQLVGNGKVPDGKELDGKCKVDSQLPSLISLFIFV